MIELPPAEVDVENAIGGVYTWESQERQYAKVGPPGTSYEEHEVVIAQIEYKPTGTVLVEAKATVGCVLHRNRKGHLVGILNYYDTDSYDWDGTLLESAGNVNLWVRPNRRRRGIGSVLVRAALHRWPEIDFTQQRYTEAGRALAARIIEEDSK